MRAEVQYGTRKNERKKERKKEKKKEREREEREEERACMNVRTYESICKWVCVCLFV